MPDTTSDRIDVIGAGLAGCEAAWQLARRGVKVRILEMKPQNRTPAHKSDAFAELVCSNSLRSDRLSNAVGLLKAEMEQLDSLIMVCARKTQVPAGGALAVDREAFASCVTQALRDLPGVEIETKQVSSLEPWLDGNSVVVAPGPLCTQELAQSIGRETGADFLSFFDAVSPIVTASSINEDIAFWASRYDRGSDYLNCPMDKKQYLDFYENLRDAQRAPLHDFETVNVFEGCMPIETMAERGVDTMRFGPLKPRGLKNPATGKESYACVQLRKEDTEGRLLSLVGFQTRLKFGEQKRVFSLIPGLEDAEFVRYGVMHKNTFIRGPQVLDSCFRLRKKPWIYFAGQITGVEGYVESAASGLLAGLFAACTLTGKALPAFSANTALGALCTHVSSSASADYQPSNINFGMMNPPDERIRGKEERNLRMASRALQEIREMKEQYSL